MSNAPTEEKVLSVEHFTDRLFRFEISRPTSFRFRSGEFIMIGLPKTEEQRKPIMRAYSVASPSWDEKLEFYSIKVPDGPLTSRLQKIKEGDTILLGKKPVGTLVLDHTCRQKAELSYGLRLVGDVKEDPLVGEMVDGKLLHIASLTREEYPLQGRITTLIKTGDLFKNAGTPPLNPEEDRVMICGSMDMINDTKALVETPDSLEFTLQIHPELKAKHGYQSRQYRG